MNHAEILALYDQERRDLEVPQTRREATAAAVRHIVVSSPRSWIAYSHYTPETVATGIEEQIAYFEGIGHSFEWKVYDHDQPPDLRERLAARGFEVGEPEAFLVLDVVNAPQALLQPITHDVRRLTDPDKLDDYAAVTTGVWGDDAHDFMHDIAATLRHDPEQLSVYVAYADGKPVSCARASFHPQSKFSGMWAGATLPEYRGQGFYQALVAVRVQEARSRGVPFMTIDALPTSRPIVEKHGFQFMTYTYPCEWKVTR